MRPVFIPNQPANYDEAQELSRNSSVPKVNAYNNVVRMLTRQEAMTQLQLLINNWVSRLMPKRGNAREWSNNAEKTQYETYKGQYGTAYGNARGDLINAAGQYCSYCEMPSLSNLQVEHLLPKSNFPDEALNWSNFLLACSSCNATKGDKPNQNLNAVFPNLNANIVPTAQAKTYNLSLQNYLWPQRYWQPLGLHIPLPYKTVICSMVTVPTTARGFAAGTWDWGSPLSEQKIEAIYLKYQNGEAFVRNGRWSVRAEVGRGYDSFGARIVPNPAAPQALQQPVNGMIALTNLNAIVSNANNQTVDRRVELRTEAVFKAMSFRQMLQNAYAQNDQFLAQAVTHQMTLNMISTGFWSVWLQVLGTQNGIQQILANSITGTAQRAWVV